MGFTLHNRYDTMIEMSKLNQTRGGIILKLSELWNQAEAILFDFDGVLADSEPLYRKSWNLVLADYAHSIPEKDYWKYWAFLGEGLAGEMKRTGLRVKDREAARSRQKTLYAKFCMDGQVPFFPFASAVLEMTIKRKQCAIASNTDSNLITAMAGKNIYSLPPVIGGEGLRHKPFPDIFLKASKFLLIEPSRCLVFEDAWKGVKAAESAGMPAVLVRNGYNTALPATEALCEIQGLEELYQFLKEL